MKSLNHITLIGNLTRDPKKKDADGVSVTNCSIAVGDVKDRTDFFNLTAWNKLADIMAEYGKKGQKVCVTGRMKQGKYQKDGVDHTSYDVQVEFFQILDKKTDKEDAF